MRRVALTGHAATLTPMKHNFSRKILICPLVSMALLTGQEVSALSPRSRPAEGLLVSLDLVDRSLWFQPVGHDRPVELALTRQTRFLRNQTPVAADGLKPGVKVIVHYRSPFFGKPFITKVTWSEAHEPG